MGDLEVKKIFVGGLSPDTSEDDLKSHFGVYGDIEHCEVKKDPGNQYRSKGFGFVTFVDDSSVDKALGAGAHNIGGRSVDTKRATKKKSYEPEKPKKCFLGGIPNDLTDEQIREQFDQFGEIVEVVFPTEKGTEKRRGFAFVTYNDPICVENAVAHAKTNPIYFPGMNEKPADVKPATPREQDRGGRGGFGQRRGGFGGRGGRGGGYGGGRGGGYGGGYGGDRYGGSGGYDSYNQGGYNSGYGNNGYSDYNQGGGGGYSGYGQGGGGYDSYSSGGGGYGQQSYGGGGGGGDYGSYGKAPRGGQRKPRGGYQPY